MLATYVVNTLAPGHPEWRDSSEPKDPLVSLDYALRQSDVDAIRFSVSGTIQLRTSVYEVKRPLDIQGSAAPYQTPAVLIDGRISFTASHNTVRGLGFVGPAGYNLAALSFSGGGGNVIADCRFQRSGVSLSGSSDNVITGNVFDGGGIQIRSDTWSSYGPAKNNRIGGTAFKSGNVICAVRGSGIDLSGVGTTGTVIQGNFIGTDSSGLNPGVPVDYGPASSLGNYRGIAIASATDTLIGGTVAGAGNVIGGNILGIWVGADRWSNQTARGTTIQGNRIGVGSVGTVPLPNWDGIVINGASQTLVGGTVPGAANVIANSVKSADGDGIGISIMGDAATGNRILGNAIYGNSGPGIDLGDDGPTANDSKGHVGPNAFQNFPTLSRAADGSVQGTLTSQPATKYRVEIFASAAPSGLNPPPAQGLRLVTSLDVTTDSKGTATFQVPKDPTAAEYVATATSPDGNTSEFTLRPPVTTLSVTVVPSLARVHPGSIISVDVTAIAKPGSTGTSFTVNAPAGTTLIKDFKKVPSVTFQAAGDRATGSFGLEVKDISQLPRGLKSIVLTAAAVTKLPGGTTATQNGTTSLAFDADLDVAVTPSQPSVRPKDSFAYTIVVDALDPGSPFKVRAAVPTGTTVVAGSIRDKGAVETVAGKTSVVWTLPAGRHAETGFSVQVNDRSQLPPAPVRLDTEVRAEVVVDGKTIGGSGTSQVVVSQFAVQGKVFDTVLDFPNRTFVDTSKPLSGVLVKLLDAKGTVIDTTTADTKGQYAVAALKAGSYTVELSSPIFVYDQTLPLPRSEIFKQRRSVTFAADQLVPKSLDDILMPVSLLNRAATLVAKLRNFTVPATVGGLFNFFGNLASFKLDTTTSESLLRRTIEQSGQRPFAGIYTDKGAAWIAAHPGSHLAAVRDDYNACIRLIAVMELLVKRFEHAGSPDHDDDVTLADQFAKTTALVITLQGIRILGKMKVFPNPSLEQLYVRALKVDAMGDLLGRFMPKLLEQLSKIDSRFKDPTTQAQVREFVYKAVRVAFDVCSGQLKEDAVFEAVFDTLRAGLLQGYLEWGLRGDLVGLPGSQAALNKSADLAIRNVISGDTFEALAAMEEQDAAMSDRYKHIIGVGSDSLKFINTLRLAEGLTASVVKIRAKGSDVAKGLLTGLDKLGEVTEKLTAAPYILTLGLPLAELFARSADLQAVSGVAMSGSVATKTAALTSSRAVPGAAVDASPPSVSASTEYGTRLTSIQRLVNADDVKGVATAQAELERAETSLLASGWNLLDRRAAAALAGIAPLAPQVAPLAAFRALLPAVERDVARFNLYLHVWSNAPSAAERASARDVITPLLTKLRTDISAAATAEPAAVAALATTTLPGFLIIEPSADALAVDAGGMAKLAFNVTNVGQKATVAGTASLSLGAGATIQGSASLPLPAVAAGATTKLTWTLRGGRPQTDDFVIYRIQVTPRTGLPNAFEEILLVRAAFPTIPNPIDLISTKPGDGRATLSWSVPDSDGGRPITDYKVEYTSDLGKTWTAFAHAASTLTSIAVTGLANGTAYYFRVSAVNDRGSSQARTTPVPVTPRTVPGIPGVVTAVAGAGKATVSWTAPASNGGAAITDYRIESSLDAGKTWTVFAHPVSAATSIAVTGLTKGKASIFRVAAVNEAGAGATRQSAVPIVPT